MCTKLVGWASIMIGFYDLPADNLPHLSLCKIGNDLGKLKRELNHAGTVHSFLNKCIVPGRNFDHEYWDLMCKIYSSLLCRLSPYNYVRNSYISEKFKREYLPHRKDKVRKTRNLMMLIIQRGILELDGNVRITRLRGRRNTYYYYILKLTKLRRLLPKNADISKICILRNKSYCKYNSTEIVAF